MTRRLTITAVTAIAAAACVIAVALSWDSIRERWYSSPLETRYLRDLDSTDARKREDGIVALGNMGSERAVPKLIGILVSQSTKSGIHKLHRHDRVNVC